MWTAPEQGFAKAPPEAQQAGVLFQEAPQLAFSSSDLFPEMVGYDYVLSIEHEDGLMSPMEGLRKALDVLKQSVIQESAGEMFWAKE